jgi:hypothetical protein
MIGEIETDPMSLTRLKTLTIVKTYPFILGYNVTVSMKGGTYYKKDIVH